MIRIICGTCETALGYKTRADGELTLPAAQEKRLVRRGVAEYVTRPVMGPVDGVDGPAEAGCHGGEYSGAPDCKTPSEVQERRKKSAKQEAPPELSAEAPVV